MHARAVALCAAGALAAMTGLTGCGGSPQADESAPSDSDTSNTSTSSPPGSPTPASDTPTPTPSPTSSPTPTGAPTGKGDGRAQVTINGSRLQVHGWIVSCGDLSSQVQVIALAKPNNSVQALISGEHVDKLTVGTDQLVAALEGGEVAKLRAHRLAHGYRIKGRTGGSDPFRIDATLTCGAT